MLFSKEFNEKVVLVTGGSSGIGKATALIFAQEGAKVVVAGRRVAEGEQTVHEICEIGGDAIFVKTDVSKASEIEALVNKTVDIYGRLDCAFNNAGVAKIASLINSSEEDWEYTLNINLKGTWLSMKYEIAEMLKHGRGAIVNMASVAGVTGIAHTSIYSASKGGIIALTKAIAIEYAKSGIRINVVSPATIHTLALNELLPANQLDKFIIDNPNPIGRLGTPYEVGEAVKWLCSDKASFITGHNLMIDGGYTA
ncbi:MAG: SDR family oxidoreductase [Cyanobacteriota bacterium]|nr:SDR family oxidoreductase [Cyanobacteriota bacterium]